MGVVPLHITQYSRIKPFGPRPGRGISGKLEQPDTTTSRPLLRGLRWKDVVNTRTLDEITGIQIRKNRENIMGYILDLRKIVGTQPLIMAGACVLIFNEQSHLLLQRRTDSYDWGTIGGSLEPGESLEEAAARELHEEAGLTAKNYRFITLLSGKDMYYQYPNGDEVYNVMALYEAIDVQGNPMINDKEGLELKYFSLDEPIHNINPFTKHVLRKSGYIKRW